jgi:S-adenosylmethionine synthetase
MINTFGTRKYTDEELEKKIHELFDPCFATINKKLDLWKPIFKMFASYDHIWGGRFGCFMEKSGYGGKVKRIF